MQVGMHSHVSENRKSKFGKFTTSVLRAFRLMRWDTATDTATAHKTKVAPPGLEPKAAS